MLLALTSTAPRPVLKPAPEGTTRTDMMYSGAPVANGLPSTAQRAAESRVGTVGSGNTGNIGITGNAVILGVVFVAVAWALFHEG